MKRILVVDDEKNMRWALGKALTKAGYQVLEAESGPEALALLQQTAPHLILLDLKMPQMDGIEALERIKGLHKELPVIILTAHGTMESAVKAIKLGATDFISKPFELDKLMVTIENALGVVALKEEINYLRAALEENWRKPIIGNSAGLLALLQSVQQVAKTNATVLILGESGTGKELVANALHGESPRADKPLIKINCGAIPENLIESELFGHEKGAFTGAIQRRQGRFEQANGGTLFLDEVGELSLGMQVKLLRVLQEQELVRVGGNQAIKVDIRVVAATNRDLKQMVTEGNFREDLYYRLNVIPLLMPPLRERREDIPLLINHFLKVYGKESAPLEIDPEAMAYLMKYPWPGNIRELENVVERMTILSVSGRITVAQLPREISQEEEAVSFRLPEEGISLEKLEKDLIIQALERTGDNQTHAAKLLGISRHTLLYRMEKYQLKLSKGERYEED